MPGMPMPILRDSNQQELRAFDDTCARLGGFAPHINFEWADGFLTALAASRQLPPLEEWLPALCGDAFERAFADPPAAAAAQRALKTRLAVLREQLDPENLMAAPEELYLNPLMALPEPDEDQPEGAVWAEGFLAGTEAVAAQWVRPDAATELDDAVYYDTLFEPIVRLLGDSAPPGTATPADGTADAPAAAAEPDAISTVLYAVQDLRMFWIERAPAVATRRVEAQPGRNDPCPCGSGRKFKKCHGAAAA
jgi:uncharacterized protein